MILRVDPSLKNRIRTELLTYKENKVQFINSKYKKLFKLNVDIRKIIDLNWNTMHSIMIFNKHTYHDAIIMMFFITEIP